MTYNVFGGTLSLTQSSNHVKQLLYEPVERMDNDLKNFNIHYFPLNLNHRHD